MTEPTPPITPDPRRQDNGLTATKFVPLAEFDPQLSEPLLTILAAALIPAFVETAQDRLENPMENGLVQLHVAEDRIEAARNLLVALADQPAEPKSAPPESAPKDLLSGIDTDAEFDRLMSQIAKSNDPANQQNLPIGPITADFSAISDIPELADEHFVPEPPPPMPHLATATIQALLVTLTGVAVIAFGGRLDLPLNLRLLLGVGLIITGAWLLLHRLHPEPRDEAIDGDGAEV